MFALVVAEAVHHGLDDGAQAHHVAFELIDLGTDRLLCTGVCRMHWWGYPRLPSQHLQPGIGSPLGPGLGQSPLLQAIGSGLYRAQGTPKCRAISVISVPLFHRVMNSAPSTGGVTMPRSV